jgi:hypothetical protein
MSAQTVTVDLNQQDAVVAVRPQAALASFTGG